MQSFQELPVRRILQEGSSGSDVTPLTARRRADDAGKDAREMALVRDAAGDGPFARSRL